MLGFEAEEKTGGEVFDVVHTPGGKSITISGSLFVSARIRLKIKERQILSKMHFKPIGSSAVVELHKLTDYNSGHRDEEQLHFHFLGKAFELPAPLM